MAMLAREMHGVGLRDTARKCLRDILAAAPAGQRPRRSLVVMCFLVGVFPKSVASWAWARGKAHFGFHIIQQDVSLRDMT